MLLEGGRADERALQAEGRAKEPIALEVDRRVRPVDPHRDRTATGTLVELHPHVVADVHAVVLDDLPPDLVAAERGGPEAVRHGAAGVIGARLGRVVDDREVWPSGLAL